MRGKDKKRRSGEWKVREIDGNTASPEAGKRIDRLSLKYGEKGEREIKRNIQSERNRKAVLQFKDRIWHLETEKKKTVMKISGRDRQRERERKKREIDR